MAKKKGNSILGIVLIIAAVFIWQYLKKENGGDPPSGNTNQTVITEEMHNSMISVIDLGANFYEQQIVAQNINEQEALINTIGKISSFSDVASCGLSNDNSTIWIKYVSGVRSFIITKPMEESSGEDKYSNIENDLPNRRVLHAGVFSAPPPNKKKAIVLEPFDHNGSGGLKDSSPEKIVSTLQESGFEVKYARNSDVTINLLTTLNKYDVIYIHTHSGYNEDDVFLMSGEKVTAAKTNLYENKYGNSVDFGTVDGEKGYCITPEFFKSIKGFPNSLVYVSGCNTLKNNSMANALKTAGVSVYLGYNNYMMKGYATANTDVMFFKYLTKDGLSVSDALDKKPNNHYKKSHPFYSLSIGSLKTNGNINMTLGISTDILIRELKAEHKSLSVELNALNDKIQNDMYSSQVTLWEAKMTKIRIRQKEIYQRVLELKNQ